MAIEAMWTWRKGDMFLKKCSSTGQQIDWLAGLSGIAVLFLTFAVSSLSYLLIEKPFARLGLRDCFMRTKRETADTI